MFYYNAVSKLLSFATIAAFLFLLSALTCSAAVIGPARKQHAGGVEKEFKILITEAKKDYQISFAGKVDGIRTPEVHCESHGVILARALPVEAGLTSCGTK